MRALIACLFSFRWRWPVLTGLAALAVALSAWPSPTRTAPAEAPAAAPSTALDADRLARAVVRVDSIVPPDAQTARSLGTERRGSGVVIDSGGLILTIGYLILEAAHVEVTTADGGRWPADVVGYDHATGFGLLRAGHGFDAPPAPLGRSGDLKRGDAVMALGRGDSPEAAPAMVVDRRAFAGYWEYLLEDAIFTAPPHPAHSGAALIDRAGRLVGVGSLFVGDALADHPMPGNMFVPIDALGPILADLLAYGRSQEPPRPWLGVILHEGDGFLLVRHVTSGGPAAKAGLARGDRIVALGDQRVGALAEFYRRLWALGPAGTDATLTVLRGAGVETVTVTTGDRYRRLRLKPTF